MTGWRRATFTILSRPSSPDPSASPAATIRRHVLWRDPGPVGRCAGLPEHVDRNAATRIPIAPDAQPRRLEQRRQFLRDRHRAGLVECAVVAKRGEVQLQGLALYNPVARDIVDDDVGEVRLAGDRAE